MRGAFAAAICVFVFANCLPKQSHCQWATVVSFDGLAEVPLYLFHGILAKTTGSLDVLMDAGMYDETLKHTQESRLTHHDGL